MALNQPNHHHHQPHHKPENSTFIDDNLDTCPSLTLLNLPESPILPPKQRRQQDTNNNNNNNNNNSSNNNHNQNNNNQAPVSGPTPCPLPTFVEPQQSGKNKYSKVNGSGNENGNAGHHHQQRHHHNHYYNHHHHYHHQQRHRHRSISLYGINSTVEQGHKEIPIWMDDGEPRYVSGVTNKTTCNDIIKALIDDELKSGNTAQQDGCRASEGSRDYSDYIITESWGGIERSYDGNMAILPVWRAWSRVHNELRISLKKREEFQEPMALQCRRLNVCESSKSKKFSMIKWLKKLFQLNDTKQKNGPKAVKTPPKLPNKMKDKYLLDTKQYKSDDIKLILLPDQLYSGKENVNSNMKKNKLYKLSETNSKIQNERRRRIKRSRIELQCNNNYIKRRKDRPLRNSIRYRLASLYADMNQRYEKEYNLTRQLSEKCKLYRQQNEQYNKSEMMEYSVGQLQTNIEAYADDIIKTEHELLELKNEIKHDISLINNLKRMTLDESQSEIKTKSEMEAIKAPTQVAKNIAATAQEMQFVDNIYEFCDNNASMLV